MDSVNAIGTDGTHVVFVIDVLLKNDFDSDTFQQCLDAILGFGTALQLQSAANKLTVIGSNPVKNTILYHDPDTLLDVDSFEVDGQQNEKIAYIVSKFRKNFTAWIAECSGTQTEASKNSLLSGALSQALCILNRNKDDYKASRIVIFSLGADNPNYYSAQYMKLINCFFAAQKSSVMIDACSLSLNRDKEKDQTAMPATLEDRFVASILQQGCDLTEGRYVRFYRVAPLVEHLFWYVLPNSEMREEMILPPKQKVAPPAACFCHRKPLEIGYVCSVCVSIFCQFSPFCRVCNSNVLKSTLQQIVNLTDEPSP